MSPPGIGRHVPVGSHRACLPLFYHSTTSGSGFLAVLAVLATVSLGQRSSVGLEGRVNTSSSSRTRRLQLGCPDVWQKRHAQIPSPLFEAQKCPGPGTFAPEEHRLKRRPQAPSRAAWKSARRTRRPIPRQHCTNCSALFFWS